MRSIVIFLVIIVGALAPISIANYPSTIFAQQITTTTNSDCYNMQDLSTGTNGNSFAVAPGTTEAAGRWKLVSPPHSTLYSVDPAYLRGNPALYTPLPWATTPYVIPQTVSATPNGGGHVPGNGRINYITYDVVGTTAYPVGSKGTLPASSEPVGDYKYQIPFNVPPAGGKLYVYAFAADNSVTMSLVYISGPPAPALSAPTAGVMTTWSSPTSVTNFPGSTFPGSYYLQALVHNADPSSWTALAVYAVFCSNRPPPPTSHTTTTTITMWDPSAVTVTSRRTSTVTSWKPITITTRTPTTVVITNATTITSKGHTTTTTATTIDTATTTPGSFTPGILGMLLPVVSIGLCLMIFARGPFQRRLSNPLLAAAKTQRSG